MSASQELRPLGEEEKTRFSWARRPPAAKIVAALEAARAGSARFVGGCVRDSLLGATPKDIDVATTLTPEAVVTALKRAGLRAAPTGIEHGTVTGVAGGVGVEITTLRSDVSTDGRRAVVAFTEDWASDARRRDFTINAIYLTTDGFLFDPAGGLADLAAGRVRFIGAARDRIREDYLRILRFFRFSARFAQDFDETGLAACAGEKAGVARLSAERVGDELSKILALPRAPFAVEAMNRLGILAVVWPAPARLDAFAGLKRLASDAPAPLGLAALWGESGEGVDAALRLSNADAARRRAALKAAAMLSPETGRRAGRVVYHRCGERAFRDGALIAAARGAGEAFLTRMTRLADADAPPPFPFTGKDAIALGLEAGPAVAAALKAAEAAWIDEDFPDRSRAAELLDVAVRGRRG